MMVVVVVVSGSGSSRLYCLLDDLLFSTLHSTGGTRVLYTRDDNGNYHDERYVDT